MIYCLRLAIVVLTLLLWQPFIYASNFKYTKFHYNIHNGLKSDKAQAVSIDKNGFLWIANGDYLLSYNGKVFLDLTANQNSNGNSVGSIGYFHRSKTNDLIFDDHSNHFRSDGSFKMRVIGDAWSPKKTYNHLPFENFTNHIDYSMSSLTDYTKAYHVTNKNSGLVFNIGNFSYFNYENNSQSELGKYDIMPHGFMSVHDTFYVATDRGMYISFKNKLLAFKTGYINKSISDLKYEDIFRIFWVHGKYFIYSKKGLFYAYPNKKEIEFELLIPATDLPKATVASMEWSNNFKTIFLSTFTEGLYEYRMQYFIHDHHPKTLSTSMNSLLYINDTLYSNNHFKWNKNLDFIGRSIKFPLDFYNLDYLNLPNDYFLIENTLKRNSLIYNKAGILVNELPIKSTSGVRTNGNNLKQLYIFQDSVYLLKNNKFESYPLQIPIVNNAIRSNHSAIWYNDTLWIGAGNGLIYCINGKSNFLPSLRKLSIRRLQIDPYDDGFFIFTYGNGIYHYTKGTIKKQFDLNEEFKFSHYFILDKKNRVWIATNNGIFVTTYKLIFRFDLFFYPKRLDFY